MGVRPESSSNKFLKKLGVFYERPSCTTIYKELEGCYCLNKYLKEIPLNLNTASCSMWKAAAFDYIYARGQSKPLRTKAAEEDRAISFDSVSPREVIDNTICAWCQSAAGVQTLAVPAVDVQCKEAILQAPLVFCLMGWLGIEVSAGFSSAGGALPGN